MVADNADRPTQASCIGIFRLPSNQLSSRRSLENVQSQGMHELAQVFSALARFRGVTGQRFRAQVSESPEDRGEPRVRDSSQSEISQEDPGTRAIRS